MPKPRAIYLLRPDALPQIYGPDQQTALAELVEFVAPPQNIQSVQENPSVLADVDFIFSGWGMPEMNEEFLAAAPNLKALFYGSGSVKKIVTDASWASENDKVDSPPVGLGPIEWKMLMRGSREAASDVDSRFNVPMPLVTLPQPLDTTTL